jgi:signal recognition particle subunit SRP72
VAAYIGSGRAAEVPALMATLGLAAQDSFEAAYNAGCADLAQGRPREARQQLLLAQRLGREALLEEECTETEVEEQLLPSAFCGLPPCVLAPADAPRASAVSVQLAYVGALQGRKKEAMDAYTRLLKLKPTDTLSAAVAANNLVAERGSHELFDGLKRLDKMLERGGAGTRCCVLLERVPARMQRR